MHKAGGAPLWLWWCEYGGSDDGLVIVLALKVYLFKVGDDGKSWLLCEGIVVMIGSWETSSIGGGDDFDGHFGGGGGKDTSITVAVKLVQCEDNGSGGNGSGGDQC